jgi:hypothetical protein
LDPVTMILTALAAGAALGVKDTASTAVKDAYRKLKAHLKKRLASRVEGELVLARFEEAPEAWQGRLAADLVAVRASADADLMEAARELMKLTDADGQKEGKFNVQVLGGQGVQIGDHGTQHNSFGVQASSRVLFREFSS